MGLVCAIAWKHAREVRNAQKILVFILVFVKMVIKVYLEGVYYSFAKSFFGGMARRHRAISAYAEASFRLRAGRRSKPARAVGKSGHHIKPTLREVYPAFKQEAFHFPACRRASTLQKCRSLEVQSSTRLEMWYIAALFILDFRKVRSDKGLL